MQKKKNEELLKEKKRRVNNTHHTVSNTLQQTHGYLRYSHTACHLSKDQEAKKEEVVASFAAWKEKKTENLKAKAKEKQEIIRKEQRAIEEKEEKRESAKQVSSSFVCIILKDISISECSFNIN